MSASEISSFCGEYRFLSNFFVHPLSYNGMTWKSSEHAYQAAKTNDQVEMLRVKMANTPGIAKSLGREITIRPDWDEVKYDIMKAIVTSKFSDPVLAAKLIATGDAELIEGNTWGDVIWGCVKGKDGQWEGRNLLGRVLMDVRKSLQA